MPYDVPTLFSVAAVWTGGALLLAAAYTGARRLWTGDFVLLWPPESPSAPGEGDPGVDVDGRTLAAAVAVALVVVGALGAASVTGLGVTRGVVATAIPPVFAGVLSTFVGTDVGRRRRASTTIGVALTIAGSLPLVA